MEKRHNSWKIAVFFLRRLGMALAGGGPEGGPKKYLKFSSRLWSGQAGWGARWSLTKNMPNNS
jgi:hypothetical protein